MKMPNFLRVLVAVPFILCMGMRGGNGCDGDRSADAQEHNVVDNQQQLYARNQRVPEYQWSLERHLMIQLYNARNQALTTYSYVINQYNGTISWSCTSLGFPFSAATQLTNPMRTVEGVTQGEFVTIPQPEPNGIYSPSSSEGTWVMCAGEDGNVEPVYIEERVRTYTRPMEEHEGRLVPVASGHPSITLDPRQPPTSH